ncbi:MAG: SCP2 sterol-binding domain-containing protein [Pirellulales bacterium]|nr:SCP2 sterol-binding domain-containing protein [Pirellulales bacterium]
MAIGHCSEIFAELPNRFNGAAAGDWKANIQFNISGDKGGDWVVRVENGAVTVNQGTDPSPSCTISTSDETWIGLVEGTVNPMMAFTMGKLKVKGNMGDVMKLQSTMLKK